MQANITPYRVEILTPTYHITGEMRPRGNPGVFLNDAAYPTFAIYAAHLQPIVGGARIGAMSVEELYVPKSEVHLISLPDYPPSEAMLLPTKHALICFTDTYVIRGEFHSGPETKAADVFYFSGGPFFPGSDLEAFPVKAMAADVALRVPLAYVHREAIRAFYTKPPQ
jgi:hypothetical protein